MAPFIGPSTMTPAATWPSRRCAYPSPTTEWVLPRCERSHCWSNLTSTNMPTSLGEYSGRECTVYECVCVCELILVAPRLNYLLTNLKNTLKSLRYGQAEITDKCARAPLCVCLCVCVCSLFSQSIRIWLLAGCVFIFRFTSNADLERHSKRRNCNDRCTATHTYTHMQWHMHIKC